MKKTKRIICRIPEDLDADLQRLASDLSQSQAEIIRTALSEFVEKSTNSNKESWYKRAVRLGVIKKHKEKLPSDLSTNKKYFGRFGK